MKKIFAYAIAMSLAGSASAASIGFDFGTNFYKPHASGYTTENGQNFTISWNLDSDVSFGIYTEQSNYTGATPGVLSVSAVQIAKGVMKNVTVGLKLGSATTAAGTAPLADIFGAVNIITSSGDKVEGALRATASARFSNAVLNAAPVAVADGVNLGLSVQVAF